MENFIIYYTTGIYAVIEKVMIFFLLSFLAWNVKLYLEKNEDTGLEDENE